MYERVLIPTDGSDHAIRAARHGLWLADTFDADVEVLTVLDTQRIAGPFDAGGLDESYLEQLEVDRREYLDEVAALAPTAKTVEKTVLRGRPADQILEHAADTDADLIAMGTRGRSGLERYLVGSVAEGVLRQSSIPVFTTQATDHDESRFVYSDVLVPTDGSETARTAIDHAIEIASVTNGHVHGLSAFEAGAIEATAGPDSELEARLREQFESAAETVARRAGQAGLHATTTVREGRPRDAIDAYVIDHDVDLIVIGTHGRSGLERYLLGSTTEWLLRHTDVPVLAVPPADVGQE